jgi:hypothetical protein
MRMAFLPIVLLLAMGTASQPEPQRHFLDLSDRSLQVSREGRPVRGACFGPGRSGGDTPIPLPLRLSLNLKSGDHRLDERVQYDVTIENVGTTAVTLPWLPSQGLADRPAERVLMASVALQTQDDEVGTLRFVPSKLEGAPEFPKSVIVLRPRDTATVRIEGEMADVGQGLAGARTPLNRELKMIAVLRLTTAPCRWAAPIVSSNAVAVTIRQK